MDYYMYDDYMEQQQSDYWCAKLYHDVEFDRNILMANNGDMNAAFSVFISLIKSIYIAEDNTKAFKYLKISADAGHKEAQFFTGMFHYLGYFETGKNYDEAFNWVLKSAQNHNKMGMYIIYKFYTYGIGTPINLEERLKWKELYYYYKNEHYDALKHLNFNDYKILTETESEKWVRYNSKKIFDN